MKEIKLTNSDKIVFVDDEDYDRVSRYKWGVHSLRIICTVKIERYRSTLASYVMNRPRVMFDHADRNPFNNQKSNLRECTTKQNVRNSSKRKGTTSQYKGVHWNKRLSKWLAKICFNGKLFHLGYFTSEVEAARAYNKAAIEFFKEFAALNDV
jgi:hypothetical protein